MAIWIDDEMIFTHNRISDIFYGDSDQLDPHFAAFKRIRLLFDFEDEPYVTDNLEMAAKFSIKFESLIINKNHFDDLKELYKDKDSNLMIGYLEINYRFEHKRLTDDIEFINKINPEILKIDKNIWTVENIKALTLLNWANVEINFGIMINEDIYLWFENTPIRLYDFNSDQMFIFEWQSIKIFIEINEYYDEYDDEKNGIEEVKLLKTNTGNFLFIPMDTIHQIEYLGFKEISRADDINKQFADLSVQNQLKENGLIIPMEYSNRIFIKLKDKNLDYLNQCKNIYKIFKEKQIKLTIKSLGRLLEINELFPDYFTLINFKYYNICLTEMSRRLLSRIMEIINNWNIDD